MGSESSQPELTCCYWREPAVLWIMFAQFTVYKMHEIGLTVLTSQHRTDAYQLHFVVEVQ